MNTKRSDVAEPRDPTRTLAFPLPRSPPIRLARLYVTRRPSGQAPPPRNAALADTPKRSPHLKNRSTEGLAATPSGPPTGDPHS